MAEQITWTHVDKLVRQLHSEAGLMRVGTTDAEVAYNFVKFLSSARTKAENTALKLSEYLMESERRARNLDHRLSLAQQETAKGKTKQRLAILEEQVAKLLEAADL